MRRPALLADDVACRAAKKGMGATDWLAAAAGRLVAWRLGLR